MIIPHAQLNAQTLDAVIEEYATRDGTDLTDASVKLAQIRKSLDAGHLLVTWDEETSTCNIITKNDLEKLASEPARTHTEGGTELCRGALAVGIVEHGAPLVAQKLSSHSDRDVEGVVGARAELVRQPDIRAGKYRHRGSCAPLAGSPAK